jgi:hypothetical protein
MLDFSTLTDDQLVGLIREALQEVVRRGPAVEAAARAAGLDEAEKAKVAAAAAQAEARRLRDEEARRVAEEAAAKVRQEADEHKADAERDKAAILRGIAREARSLFGSDQPEFTVALWEKPGDRRIYIGHGYNSNWVEYHHDGDHRTAPGTCKAIAAVVDPLAEHLGVMKAEAREKVADFCRRLIERKFRGKLEVNASNAPIDPATLVDEYVLAVPQGDGTTRYGKTNRNTWYGYNLADADPFPTREAALAAAAKHYVGPGAGHLTDSLDKITLATRKVRRAFPPKGGA